MNATWNADYATTSKNAFSVEWFVSPLEYMWGNGKAIADQAFRGLSQPNANFDAQLAPSLYRTAMVPDFRSKMVVYAVMREPIAKTFALEIESGLMSLYRLDFLSCMSSWISLIEGYCRQLFNVSSLTNVKSAGWTVPQTGIASSDQTITTVCNELGHFLDNVVYKTNHNTQTSTLNRHLMLHGNSQNRNFFSQKNSLSLMFVLDALVLVEMFMNNHWPSAFHHDEAGDADCIKRRITAYTYELAHAMSPQNALKLSLLDEHV